MSLNSEMRTVTRPSTRKQENRILWVDYAKAIGLLLVIIIHCNLRDTFSSDIMSSFAISLFFFISGFLFKPEKTFYDDVKKAFRTLLVPYFLFSVIFYPVWLEGYIRHPEIYPDRSVATILVKPLLGMFLGYGYNTSYSITTDAPLWFLPALFFGKIILSGLLEIVSRKSTLVWTIMAFMVVVLLHFISSPLVRIFSIGPAIMVIPFLYLGYLAKHAGLDFSGSSRIPVMLGLSAGFVITLALTRVNGLADVDRLIFGRSAALFYLNAASGIVLAVSLAIMLGRMRSSIVSFVSKNSLTIFAVHYPPLLVTLEILSRFIKSEPYNRPHSLVYSIIVSIIVMAECLLPALVVSRWFPFMVGRKRIVRGGDTAYQPSTIGDGRKA